MNNFYATIVLSRYIAWIVISNFDRLTRSVLGKTSVDAEIDAGKLKEQFGNALYELFHVRAKVMKKTVELENKCIEDEREFHKQINKLGSDLSNSQDRFKVLGHKIQEVSGKLAHLSDLLENKNLPRKNIEEARQLILDMFAYFGAGRGAGSYSQKDDVELLETAKRLKKLSNLCLELPDDESFQKAKQRVDVENRDLEKLLVDRFDRNFSNNNRQAIMKQIADFLANSNSRTACAEVYVRRALEGLELQFQSVPASITMFEKEIMTIFSRPESVMSLLLSELYNNLLKRYLNNRIRFDAEDEIYLHNLSLEYSKVSRLNKILKDELTLRYTSSELSRLFQSLFAPYLGDYFKRERRWLKASFRASLDDFYASHNHQKRNAAASGLQEFKQTILHITPSERESNTYNKLLLSRDLSIDLLDKIRKTSDRSRLLCNPSELINVGSFLFQLIDNNLMEEHVKYGVKLAARGIKMTDYRDVKPNFVFFSVIHETVMINDAFNKTFDNWILPLIKSSTSPDTERNLIARRDGIGKELEMTLQGGLESCLTLAVAHIQHLLSSEQKKSDFRPEIVAGEHGLTSGSTRACQLVVTFWDQLIKESGNYLDGLNLHNFRTELGLRVARSLMEHFYGFTFSETGGLIATQDISVYREVAMKCENPTVDCLFDVMLKLMNLMVVKPQYVGQVMQEYRQSKILQGVLDDFIHLRSDYKLTKSYSE